MLLFAVLTGYTAWLVLGSRPDPAHAISVLAGVALWGAGVSPRWWAIAALGEHWRIGQDDKDQRAAFVAAGPYRFMRHPINAALIVAAAGMTLLTGPEAPALGLLGVSILY